MKYVVDINGERVHVELEGNIATVNGESVDVAMQTIAGTPVRLVRIGNAMHRVTSRRQTTNGRGAYALDVDGFRYEVLTLDERTRAIRDLSAKSEVASGPAPLKARKNFAQLSTSVVTPAHWRAISRDYQRGVFRTFTALTCSRKLRTWKRCAFSFRSVHEVRRRYQR